MGKQANSTCQLAARVGAWTENSSPSTRAGTAHSCRPTRVTSALHPCENMNKQGTQRSLTLTSLPTAATVSTSVQIACSCTTHRRACPTASGGTEAAVWFPQLALIAAVQHPHPKSDWSFAKAPPLPPSPCSGTEHCRKGGHSGLETFQSHDLQKL